MPKKSCLGCGRLHNNNGPRCKKCTARRRKKSYGNVQYKRNSLAAITLHKLTHGDWCPGWGEPAHNLEEGNVLTADHSIPFAVGGTADGANLGVLCRRCNGRKADHHGPSRT